MADDASFEPKLGRIGNTSRRPASQLKKLAHFARHGEPRTFGRRRFAPRTIAAQGRGHGAAATASLWAAAGRRRVYVRVTIALARGTNTSAFSQHLRYIQRDGTDRDGSRTKLFGRDSEDVSRKAFDKRSREDSHQFRILVAPDDAERMEDLTVFTRRLMAQVERDFTTEVDWIAACHYNTSQPHLHIAIRGGNARDGEVFIARKYITQGLRHRAEDLVTQELGYETWRDLSVNRRWETFAERFTSIDRHLSQLEQDGTIVLAPRSAGSEQRDLTPPLWRLRHLRRLGLAAHVHGNEWRLLEGWTETLKSMGERTAAIEALDRRVGDRLNLRAIEEPAPGSIGGWVTGRLSAIIAPPRPGAEHLIALEGLDGRTWMLRVPEHELSGLPTTGAVISAYIPAMQPDRALTRRTSAGNDPAETSLSLPSLSVNSWLAIDDLTQRRAFTWLDELSADAALQLAAGFGAEVRAAWQARQTFLKAEGLDQVSREDLRATELSEIAASEARRLQKRYVALGPREIFRGLYTRNIDTAQGRFALIEGEGRFILVPQTDDMPPFKGQTVTIERSALFRSGGIAGGRGLER